MQRYFVNSSFTDSGEITLHGAHYKHIVRVMRMEIGFQLIVVSNEGAYVTTIEEITDEFVKVKREGDQLPSNELPIDITIVNGLAKGDKHDLIVQKATELGVSKVILFKAERSIVKWDEKRNKKRVERLEKIAEQAAEQCHRTVIPTIVSPLTINQLIIESEKYDVCLYADEEAAKKDHRPRLVDSVKNLKTSEKVFVVFGPEGGLSRKETASLQEAGFLSIALGPRILRTETAPLYFLSAISYEFE